MTSPQKLSMGSTDGPLPAFFTSIPMTVDSERIIAICPGDDEGRVGSLLSYNRAAGKCVKLKLGRSPPTPADSLACNPIAAHLSTCPDAGRR
ncbi:hypothetical protein EVAR_52057_1 [Eumeta japonica]|uniref:Uncharacterized protein n=1 Tax=Eumeta variegata TaxID=151549 RepID=A0A4C1Z3R1_EUMVA|nr:hypothetical protein EVAR_52057_1 [Eumeta japonica]